MSRQAVGKASLGSGSCPGGRAPPTLFYGGQETGPGSSRAPPGIGVSQWESRGMHLNLGRTPGVPCSQPGEGPVSWQGGEARVEGRRPVGAETRPPSLPPDSHVALGIPSPLAPGGWRRAERGRMDRATGSPHSRPRHTHTHTHFSWLLTSGSASLRRLCFSFSVVADTQCCIGVRWAARRSDIYELVQGPARRCPNTPSPLPGLRPTPRDGSELPLCASLSLRLFPQPPGPSPWPPCVGPLCP